MRGRIGTGIRILSQLAAPLPAPPPDGFESAAARLLRARQLAAYDWALPHVESKDLLEIGMNRGYGSRLIAPRARSFVGLDLALDHARASRRDAGVRAVQADGQALPFGGGRFDAVVTFQVIEHVWDVRALLGEIRRVLRPGGLLLVSTPQRGSRLFHRQLPWNEEHLREYDTEEWRRCLGAVFESVSLFGLFGDALSEGIERRRLWNDPWAYYFDGPWAGPVRFLGRAARRLRGRGAALPEAHVREVALAAGEHVLASHSAVRESGLDAAQDLLALCRKEGEEDSPERGFDGAAYWRQRLTSKDGLEGTGTSYAPLGWQRWLYRGKARAHSRLFRKAGLRLDGKAVLDFGCGTGYFEDLWERRGALRADGVDIVPEVIERLQAAHPRRRYLCADLAEDPSGLSRFGRPDLITALDVLYHIVEDGALLRTLRALVSILAPGGHLLFTDGLRERETSPHVRFRSLNQWRQILESLGLRYVAREPVFAVNDRLPPGAGIAPRLVGAAQHLIDLPVLRVMPWTAGNWAILALKPVRP